MKPSTSSAFLKYDLDPQEVLAAYTYSDMQVAGIQNQISEAAEAILKLPLSEDDTQIANIKRRAYLQGQLEILRYLLSLHQTFSQQLQQGSES